MNRVMNTYERTLHDAKLADQRALEAAAGGRFREAQRIQGDASLLRLKARIME